MKWMISRKSQEEDSRWKSLENILTKLAMASSDLRWVFVGAAVGGRSSELDRAGELFRFCGTSLETCHDDEDKNLE